MSDFTFADVEPEQVSALPETKEDRTLTLADVEPEMVLDLIVSAESQSYWDDLKDAAIEGTLSSTVGFVEDITNAVLPEDMKSTYWSDQIQTLTKQRKAREQMRAQMGKSYSLAEELGLRAARFVPQVAAAIGGGGLVRAGLKGLGLAKSLGSSLAGKAAMASAEGAVGGAIASQEDRSGGAITGAIAAPVLSGALHVAGRGIGKLKDVISETKPADRAAEAATRSLLSRLGQPRDQRLPSNEAVKDVLTDKYQSFISQANIQSEKFYNAARNTTVDKVQLLRELKQRPEVNRLWKNFTQLDRSKVDSKTGEQIVPYSIKQLDEFKQFLRSKDAAKGFDPVSGKPILSENVTEFANKLVKRMESISPEYKTALSIQRSAREMADKSVAEQGAWMAKKIMDLPDDKIAKVIPTLTKDLSGAGSALRKQVMSVIADERPDVAFNAAKTYISDLVEQSKSLHPRGLDHLKAIFRSNQIKETMKDLMPGKQFKAAREQIDLFSEFTDKLYKAQGGRTAENLLSTNRESILRSLTDLSKPNAISQILTDPKFRPLLREAGHIKAPESMFNIIEKMRGLLVSPSTTGFAGAEILGDE